MWDLLQQIVTDLILILRIENTFYFTICTNHDYEKGIVIYRQYITIEVLILLLS